MTLADAKTFLANSFRLRPFLIGVGVGLAAPYVFRFFGWLV